MRHPRTEWDHGKRAGISGMGAMKELAKADLRRQIRDAVGEIRMRQIQAQKAKKQVRDHVTRLLAGRIQVRALGADTDPSTVDSVNTINAAIADKATEYRDLTASYFDAVDQERAIKNEVGDTTQFEHITNDLPSVTNLVEADADFIATLSALDMLRPDVRRYILSVLDFTNLPYDLASANVDASAYQNAPEICPDPIEHVSHSGKNFFLRMPTHPLQLGPAIDMTQAASDASDVSAASATVSSATAAPATAAPATAAPATAAPATVSSAMTAASATIATSTDASSGITPKEMLMIGAAALGLFYMMTGD